MTLTSCSAAVPCAEEAAVPATGGGAPLVVRSPAGLYCLAGNFFIDPRRPVHRAVVTHAHGDHLCSGTQEIFTCREGARLVGSRIKGNARIQAVEYGESFALGAARVRLHPAGHILGSAQVRIEHQGDVWVVSGDYRPSPNSTCAPFEPVPCDTFVTEATFARPVFAWPPEDGLFAELNAWWRANRCRGRTSVVLAYALGKAQRVLAGVDPTIGPIAVHPSVEEVNAIYRETGISLPQTVSAPSRIDELRRSGALVVAPPIAARRGWLRRFGPVSTAFASGWMLLPGAAARHQVDRGFVLSDHADWKELLAAIAATGAGRVCLMHGEIDELAAELRRRGVDAGPVPAMN